MKENEKTTSYRDRAPIKADEPIRNTGTAGQTPSTTPEPNNSGNHIVRIIVGLLVAGIILSIIF